MMALIQDASQRGLDLHWDKAAKQVDPDCSGDALKQQLNKRREKVVAEGSSASPLTASRTRRTQRTTNHTSDTRDDSTQLPRSKSLRSNPAAEAAPKTLALRSASKRARESTNESDEEPETKIKRYGDCEESIDDGAIEDSDDSDWASKKLPKKKTRKVITGQVSQATRMSFSNTKGTTAAENVKNNRDPVLGTHNTGKSKELDQSRHDTDDLAHATEQSADDNQANTTIPPERVELRKSLIVALKSSGGQFINLADHPELTKFDRYNYANLPYPNDLTNEQKKAIYNANPAFALACGNKDDIRLNNFGSPGYENGMPSISQVLNSATNNQYSGSSMMSATQNTPIGPGYNGMPPQTPHYQSMINNVDLLNLPLDFGQNNGIMPQSQSTSSGYTNSGYCQQGLTNGKLPFALPSFQSLLLTTIFQDIMQLARTARTIFLLHAFPHRRLMMSSKPRANLRLEPPSPIDSRRLNPWARSEMSSLKLARRFHRLLSETGRSLIPCPQRTWPYVLHPTRRKALFLRSRQIKRRKMAPSPH